MKQAILFRFRPLKRIVLRRKMNKQIMLHDLPSFPFLISTPYVETSQEAGENR
jgi:hypothetical protein